MRLRIRGRSNASTSHSNGGTSFFLSAALSLPFVLILSSFAFMVLVSIFFLS